jgi:two-component system copper resistance phosphate regulon response regulator CusR
VIVRRHRPHQTTDIQIGDLHIDFIARRVTRRARRLSLTAKEFALLEVLARRRSHIVSKTAIAALVWDINFDTNTNVVEVAIKRLRAKLELPGEEKLLYTVRGMGYTLEPRGETFVE